MRPCRHACSPRTAERFSGCGTDGKRTKNGAAQSFGVRHQTISAPVIPARIGLSAWNSLSPSPCRKYRTRILFTKRCAQEGMAGRTSTRWRQQYAPLTCPPEFPSNAAPDAHNRKTKKRHTACFSLNCSNQKMPLPHRSAPPNGGSTLRFNVAIR